MVWSPFPAASTRSALHWASLRLLTEAGAARVQGRPHAMPSLVPAGRCSGDPAFTEDTHGRST